MSPGANPSRSAVACPPVVWSETQASRTCSNRSGRALPPEPCAPRGIAAPRPGDEPLAEARTGFPVDLRYDPWFPGRRSKPGRAPLEHALADGEASLGAHQTEIAEFTEFCGPLRVRSPAGSCRRARGERSPRRRAMWRTGSEPPCVLLCFATGGNVAHAASLGEQAKPGRPRLSTSRSIPLCYDELVSEFGEAVRSARETRGWTQLDLAVRAGVSQRAVSSWEKGVSEPGRPTKLAVACRAAPTPLCRAPGPGGP